MFLGCSKNFGKSEHKCSYKPGSYIKKSADALAKFVRYHYYIIRSFCYLKHEFAQTSNLPKINAN